MKLTLLEAKNLTHIYGAGTPFERSAICNVNFTASKGGCIGIIGATGSGKSTFVQHLNGLLKPTSGQVYFEGNDIHGSKDYTRQIRFKIGLVFQYPEYQLFESTVFNDIAFGPKNMGLSESEIRERVFEAAGFVRLDESVMEKSPFELSGGQKRRVAIAGVLAMRPEILVLDEPTSGLDPMGKKEILSLVKTIQKSMCPTVIMISHNMDEVAVMADRIAVMANGSIACIKTPKELFSAKELLESLDIKMPAATEFAVQLSKSGFDIDKSVISENELVDEIIKLYNQGALLKKEGVDLTNA